MVSLTTSNTIATTNDDKLFFIRELGSTIPANEVNSKNLAAIDAKVKEFINDPRFQFPEIAGRLHDLSLSVGRLIKPLPNQIVEELDYQGILNKVKRIMLMCYDPEDSSDLPIKLVLLASNNKNKFKQIVRIVTKRPATACVQFSTPMLPNSYSPLASIISRQSLIKMSVSEVRQCFDVMFRAGLSANEFAMDEGKILSLPTDLISMFNKLKDPKNSNELPKFDNLIEILDSYREWGHDINLQPTNQLENFFPTSYLLTRLSADEDAIAILRYLIECAQLNINMTYTLQGHKCTMLDALSWQTPAPEYLDMAFEFVETLIYYDAKFYANLNENQNAAADSTPQEPIIKGTKLYHVVERARALRKAVVAEYNIPEMSTTIHLGIKQLDAIINGYYMTDFQIARECIARKEAFNKEYDQLNPSTTFNSASNSAASAASIVVEASVQSNPQQTAASATTAAATPNAAQQNPTNRKLFKAKRTVKQG